MASESSSADPTTLEQSLDSLVLEDPAESLLLNLPSEIRLLVYQYLFNLDLWGIRRQSGCYNDAGGCCDLHLRDGEVLVRMRGWGQKAFINFAAILRTCRLINKEATPVLYDQTMFFIRVSDEQFNRTMRPYAPLDQCTFLPHVQKVKISVDTRTHKMFIGMPEILEDLTPRLTSSQSKTVVEFAVSGGSLSALPPMGTLPIEMMMVDARWLRFLERMSKLATERVTFVIGARPMRNSIQGRLDQLIQALKLEEPVS